MLMSWTLPMERMLDAWMPGSYDHQHADVAVPAADVVDDGESFRIVVDMPGVTREGLEIELEKEMLRVRGKRPAPESDKLLVNGRCAHRDFERAFTLGKDVDREGIKARLENGVLTINLPRRAEVKAQRIEVEVG
jgi:HSP20 family molecular chaperone IbpA